MNSSEFLIWLKGFTEACNDLTATPKQWDRIKEVLNEVEDYNDNPGIDVEIDDYNPSWHPLSEKGHVPAGVANTVSISSSSSSWSNTVWNDKMGCWHYTNYPEGFGYFTNSTLGASTPEEIKKQLLD